MSRIRYSPGPFTADLSMAGCKSIYAHNRQEEAAGAVQEGDIAYTSGVADEEVDTGNACLFEASAAMFEFIEKVAFDSSLSNRELTKMAKEIVVAIHDRWERNT